MDESSSLPYQQLSMPFWHRDQPLHGLQSDPALGKLGAFTMTERDERLELRTRIVKAVSSDIRRAMKQKGVSQAELARTTGLSPSVISRIAAGKRRASTEQLLLIGSALKIRADEPFVLNDAVGLEQRLERIESGEGLSFGGELRAAAGVATEPMSVDQFIEKNGDDLTPKEKNILQRSAAAFRELLTDEGFWWSITEATRLVRKNAAR